MKQLIKGKRVVFITTKDLEYIRNQQEIKLLKSEASDLLIIGSDNKSYFWRILKVYLQIIFTNFTVYDTVFIGFAPQLILPFLSWKFRKNTVIEDFFISFFDTLCCDRKKFHEDSFAGKVLLWLDKRTLRLADLVICDTKTHGKYFCDALGCDPQKLHVLYLEADLSIYYPRKKSRAEDGITHVLYFGSVLPLQGVDVIMKAVELLSCKSDLSFEIIGPVRDNMRVISDNVKYISWLSQPELAEHIANADLCLAGHFSGSIEKGKRTIPGKAYIYEAMKKPMILGENPANRERYVEGKDIWFVKMGDANALADMIVKASDQIKKEES